LQLLYNISKSAKINELKINEHYKTETNEYIIKEKRLATFSSAINRETCLATVDVFDGHFAKEDVDVVSNFVHRYEVRLCKQVENRQGLLVTQTTKPRIHSRR